MDTLDGGHYILAGDDTTNLGDNDLAFLRNARIGFVFQAFNLLSQLSVLSNIEVPMHYLGVSTQWPTAFSSGSAALGVGVSCMTGCRSFSQEAS